MQGPLEIKSYEYTQSYHNKQGEKSRSQPPLRRRGQPSRRGGRPDRWRSLPRRPAAPLCDAHRLASNRTARSRERLRRSGPRRMQLRQRRSFRAAATRSLGEPLAPAGDVLVGTVLHHFDPSWPPSSRASALVTPQTLRHPPIAPDGRNRFDASSYAATGVVSVRET